MTDKLLILGAGVDRTSGIDFPLANNLLADVTRYLDGPGKPVDQALRQMLPGLRFSFNHMIARAVDSITSREVHEQRAMVQRIQEVIDALPPERADVIRHGQLFIRLFEKLVTLAEINHLDEETEALIRAVFPNDADDLIDSDSILDIHKLSLSDTFKTVLKRTLKQGLTGDSHEVASAMGADMLNIETLLIEKFLGFYNNKASDIKNYLYIAWALWAFLVDRQKQVLEAYGGNVLPFYGLLPQDIRAITLNYTSFLQQRMLNGNAVYFHGGLAEYVRMDTRDLLAIENILNCDPAAFITEVVAPNVDVSSADISQQRHVIPALVPPLRLKPILSHRYIDLWSRAAHWVEEASHIVVVGYSFNNADEHFNDILRVHQHRRIDIVVPEATKDYFLQRMEQVFSTAARQYTVCTVQGLECRQARNVRLIAARADQVDIGGLFNPT